MPTDAPTEAAPATPPGIRVVDVMTRYVEFLSPGATARDAAVMMGELDVGSVPVGTAEQLDGIVTDRDILYRVVAAGLPVETPVADIISRPVVGCEEGDTLRTAMDLMAAHHVRRLPVRDAKGTVSGWLTLADLSRKLLVEQEVLQTALQALEAR